ncbi:MAG TPA: hypothetical protein VK338_02320 [Candidatus Nitrosocosmicus sp.]|nr:hypothetical protein [Candidatus Nitrosocosmicus sp.]
MPEHEPRGGTGIAERPLFETNNSNPHNQPERTQPNIEMAEDVVKTLKAYASTFGDPELIYFPGPHTEISPSLAFTKPNQKVIYVDKDPVPVKVLKDAGYNAVVADATKRDFNPGEVDLLILKNALSETDTPSHFVKRGGHVIAEKSWNDNVTPILERQRNLKLVGVYNREQNTFITSDLEAYKRPTHKNERGIQLYERNSQFYVFEKIEPDQSEGHTHHQETPTPSHDSPHAHPDESSHGHEENHESKKNIFQKVWHKITSLFRKKKNTKENESSGHH